jgi:hypothetical protein
LYKTIGVYTTNLGGMTDRTQSNLGVALYFVFRLGAIAFALQVGADGPIATPVFYSIFFAGTVSLVWGARAQLRMKRYPSWLAVLGLFEFPGLVVLALLPDKSRPKR